MTPSRSGIAHDIARNGNWLILQLGGRPYPDAPLYYWLAACDRSGLLVVIAVPRCGADDQRHIHSAGTRIHPACGTRTARPRTCRRRAADSRRQHRLPVSRARGTANARRPGRARSRLLGAGFVATAPVVGDHRIRRSARFRFSGQRPPASVHAVASDADLPVAVGERANSTQRGFWRDSPFAAIPCGLLARFGVFRFAGLFRPVFSQAEIAPIIRRVTPVTNGLRYLNLLLWYAWPALPLAGWALWSKRRLLGKVQLALPALSFFRHPGFSGVFRRNA